jgi:CHAD domain-containing protein
MCVCASSTRIDQGIERAADHLPHILSHARDVDGHRDGGALHQEQRPLRQVHRQVARALEVVVHLEHADDVTQVLRDRLVERQDLEALQLHLDLALVDRGVARRDLLSEVAPAREQGRDRLVRGLLDPGAERQDLLVQPVQVPLEMLRHAYPNLPVT